MVCLEASGCKEGDQRCTLKVCDINGKENGIQCQTNQDS